MTPLRVKNAVSSQVTQALEQLPFLGMPLAPSKQSKQQLDASINTRASINGSASQVFSVANATLTAHATALGQFAASLTSNGYQKLPSGLIIQWGRISGIQPPSSASQTFQFHFQTHVLEPLSDRALVPHLQ